MVISASWLSRTNEGDGTLNLRGVATVLAFSKFVKRENAFQVLVSDVLTGLAQNTLYGPEI